MDSRADQLRHRRSSLPEAAETATWHESRRQLDGQARDARIVVDDLTAEQRKVDADVENVKARRTRDQNRMDQGLVTNPKDLQRMQQETESLQRRISSLEDDELEVMERLEEAQRSLDSLTAQVEAADERLAALGASAAEKTAEIDQDLSALEAERAPAVEGMPADLLALYDRLRASKNGVGAAELHRRQCTGCRLAIDNSELAVIRVAPSDLVVRCEECTRILVRTSESGL